MNAHQITRTEDGYRLGNLLATGLPRAQSQALLLRASGTSYQNASTLLGCSVQNVKQAISTLFYKLRCDSSPELITRAFEHGHLRILALLAAAHLALMPASAPADDQKEPLRPRHQRQLARRNRGETLLAWDPETGTLLLEDAPC